jgi:hypothetical protein
MLGAYATFFSEQKFTFGLKKWSEAVHKRQLCGALRSATGVSAEHCAGMSRAKFRHNVKNI